MNSRTQMIRYWAYRVVRKLPESCLRLCSFIRSDSDRSLTQIAPNSRALITEINSNLSSEFYGKRPLRKRQRIHSAAKATSSHKQSAKACAGGKFQRERAKGWVSYLRGMLNASFSRAQRSTKKFVSLGTSLAVLARWQASVIIVRNCSQRAK